MQTKSTPTIDVTARPVSHLKSLVRDYPQIGQQVDYIRSLRGSTLVEWPTWCFIPSAAWTNISDPDNTGDMELVADADRLAAFGAWRYTQGVYSVDPILREALADTKMSGNLPSDALLRLPEWAVYVATPGMRFGAADLHGFLAYLNWRPQDGDTDLCILVDIDVPDFPNKFSISPIPIGPWTLADAFDRMAKRTAVDLRDTMLSGGAQWATPELLAWVKKPRPEMAALSAKMYGPLISILLYLCSDEPEIDLDREPGSWPANPKPRRVKRGWRLFPPNKARVWTVGRNIGESLRTDRREWHATGRTVRPHIRRAHWHGYWIGPRSEKQRFEYRWIPPVLVASPPEDE